MQHGIHSTAQCDIRITLKKFSWLKMSSMNVSCSLIWSLRILGPPLLVLLSTLGKSASTRHVRCAVLTRKMFMEGKDRC